MADSALASLRAHARTAAERAHVPFSGKRAAAALLLADGTWVPGVRVESASFSLTIPPALNAFTTAVAAGRHDVIAAAFSRPVQSVERAFMNGLPGGPFRPDGEDACIAEGASLPVPTTQLDPLLKAAPPDDPGDGVALARSVAERALVPSSRFPVGCVLAVGGTLVPGVNVEPHADAASANWTHVLCAERSALGTACSYGLLGSTLEGAPGSHSAKTASSEAQETLYLACPNDDAGSPCGACRQLLVELLPRGVLWMDRAPAPPERTRPTDLLPGSFQGAALPRSAPGA